MLRATVKPLAKAITVGLSHQGGANAFVFHAITYDPDTYEMLGVKTGTGGLTEGSTSTRYAPDHENVYRAYGSGEVAYSGGRQVTNLLTYSEDFSNAAWTTSNVTLSHGKTDPNGGTTATRVTATADNGLCYQNVTTELGEPTVFSVWVRRISGSGAIRLYYGSGSSSTSLTITDTNWKRYTVSNASVADVSGRFGVRIVGNGDVIEIAFSQGELSTGRSDTTTPSEYVPTTTAAATKTYANTNGNSVASNVVTEAVGAALAEAPYAMATPTLTNSLTYSTPDAVNWSETGTSVIGAAATGLDGGQTAVVLTDDDGSSVETVADTLTIADDSNTNVARVWVDKDADTSRFPLFTWAFSGGTGVSHEVALNTSTGATAESGTGSHDVRDAGNWWEVLIALPNNGTGNTTGTLTIAPANAASLTVTPAAATTGSITCGGCEAHTNSSIAAVRGAGFVATSGAPVTQTASALSFDDANHDDTQGAWYAEHLSYGFDASVGIGFIGLANPSLLYTNSSQNLRSADGTTSITATGLLNDMSVSGTSNKIGLVYGDGNFRVNGNGTYSAASAYDGAFNNTLLKIAICTQQNPANATSTTQLIRNIRRYDLDYTAAQAQIDELMT